jgi:hypothetical protein
MLLSTVFTFGLVSFAQVTRILSFSSSQNAALCLSRFPSIASPPKRHLASRLSRLNSVVEAISEEVAVPKKIAKGKSPEFALANDSTEETATQRYTVYAHFALLLFNIYAATSHMSFSAPADYAAFISTIYMSIVLGDLGTGIFHWSVDNYGSLKTPLVGSVCAAFQGHHETPWTITFRPFANNVYKIAYGTIPTLALVALLPDDYPLQKLFFSLFANWWLVSQELHKYSHMTQLPPVVKFLQDRGVILSRKEHGRHHKDPFEAHYCILTGQCNEFLDNSNFFRSLEKVVYNLTGNRPITWNLDEEVERAAMGVVATTSSTTDL